MISNLIWLFKLSLIVALTALLRMVLIVGILWCLITLATAIKNRLFRVRDRW